MRVQVVVVAALLAATLGQATPPALLPVKLASPGDAIRSSTNLVPLQMHAPPPLDTALEARAVKETRTWIPRAPETFGSTPIPPPMGGSSDPDEEVRHLLDPDREAEFADEDDRGTAHDSAPRMEQEWGWLANTVIRMEATERPNSAQMNRSPWDEILDERDEADADDSLLDGGYTSRSPFDDFRSEDKSDARWAGFDDTEQRDAFGSSGEPKSARVESDYGLSGLGGTEDER